MLANSEFKNCMVKESHSANVSQLRALSDSFE